MCTYVGESAVRAAAGMMMLATGGQDGVGLGCWLAACSRAAASRTCWDGGLASHMCPSAFCFSTTTDSPPRARPPLPGDDLPPLLTRRSAPWKLPLPPEERAVIPPSAGDSGDGGDAAALAAGEAGAPKES